MTTITAEIPGKPVPCPRPRVSKHGTHYPKRYTDWKSGAQALLRDACVKQNGGRLMEGRLSVRMHFTGAAGNVDIDNCIKAILDAGQGQIYENDRQVKHVEAWSMPGDPMTRVIVRPLEGSD